MSVLREICRELPHEDVLYVADSGHAPYGDKPAEAIEARAVAIARFLTDRSAKAIVVACNTATGIAIEALRSELAVPVIAIEPALKPAAARTRSGVVGILATTQTLASARLARLVVTYGGNIRVALQPCPGWAEQVERGDLSGPETRALVERSVRSLLAKGADTLVLGCTHYPFLVPLIRAVAGPSVAIVDPSAAVARELRRRLEANGLLSQGNGPGTVRFLTSGDPAQVASVIGRLWAHPVDVQRLPDSLVS